MNKLKPKCKKTHGLISLDRWCDYFLHLKLPHSADCPK